jgi:tetratricopeptide (TPR) repeat protein
MSDGDWFRNRTWNASVAAEFEAKLKRARRKEQYLRIQASTIAESHPEVALRLLGRFFALPDQFDAAQAHVDRATAYLAQGRIPEAVASFESALSRESEFPKVLTQAFIDLPFLIATRGIREHYDRALQLLSQHRARLMFPVDRFKWNAAHALIANHRGEPFQEFSRTALAATQTEQSGFTYHPRVGLVGASLAETVRQMRRLCAA